MTMATFPLLSRTEGKSKRCEGKTSFYHASYIHMAIVVELFHSFLRVLRVHTVAAKLPVVEILPIFPTHSPVQKKWKRPDQAKASLLNSDAFMRSMRIKNMQCSWNFNHVWDFPHLTPPWPSHLSTAIFTPDTPFPLRVHAWSWKCTFLSQFFAMPLRFHFSRPWWKAWTNTANDITKDLYILLNPYEDPWIHYGTFSLIGSCMTQVLRITSHVVRNPKRSISDQTNLVRSGITDGSPVSGESWMKVNEITGEGFSQGTQGSSYRSWGILWELRGEISC